MSRTSFNYDDRQRGLLQAGVYLFVLISLMWRWNAQVLLHQLEQPVLVFPHVDVTYWVLHLLRIPELLVSNPFISWTFDLSLVGAALAAIIWRNSVWPPRIFGILFALYFFSFNTFGMHHTHCITGILVISIPFCFRPTGTFNLTWEGLRFWTIFLYFDAFVFKLLRGSLFNMDQAVANVQGEALYYMVQNPASVYTDIYAWMFTHPLILQGFYEFAMLLEAVFLIGFFTRRYDWLLLALAFAFHIGTHNFVDVVFFEVWVLNFLFLKFDKKTP